jgi:hypothetical protein
MLSLAHPHLHAAVASAAALPYESSAGVAVSSQPVAPAALLAHHPGALPPRFPLMAFHPLAFPLLACCHRCCRRIIDVLEGEHGVEVRQLWGMTELSPCGTLGAIKASAGQPASSLAVVCGVCAAGGSQLLCAQLAAAAGHTCSKIGTQQVTALGHAGLQSACLDVPCSNVHTRALAAINAANGGAFPPHTTTAQQHNQTLPLPAPASRAACLTWTGRGGCS